MFEIEKIKEIKAEIISEEGFSPYAYSDSLGYMTIGYGRCIDKRKGSGISRYEAGVLLENDIRAALIFLKQDISFFDSLPDGVARALVNMAYQLGLAGVLRFKKMLAAMEKKDWKEAAAQALDSEWAKQTPARAKRIASMIEAGL